MKQKIINAIVILALIILITMFIYRHFLEFKNDDVKQLINEESKKFSDKDLAYKLIHEACNHILNSSTLLKQVKTYAAKTNTPKEKVLVDVAVAQCYANNYFVKPIRQVA